MDTQVMALSSEGLFASVWRLFLIRPMLVSAERIVSTYDNNNHKQVHVVFIRF